MTAYSRRVTKQTYFGDYTCYLIKCKDYNQLKITDNQITRHISTG